MWRRRAIFKVENCNNIGKGWWVLLFSKEHIKLQMKTLVWLDPEALGGTPEDSAEAVCGSLWQWWSGLWKQRQRQGVVLVTQGGPLGQGYGGYFPEGHFFSLPILRVWGFFHSFPGKSLKVLKVLSILKQTQGSIWLRLKEFVTTGLIWQSKCPTKWNYHPWCHHSDQTTLILWD